MYTRTDAPVVLVQSLTLSPTSTSSADLSFGEYDESLLSTCSMFSLSGTDLVNTSPLVDIWHLDGTESKSLSVFPLPTHQELMGCTTSSRNSSLKLVLTRAFSSRVFFAVALVLITELFSHYCGDAYEPQLRRKPSR
ncbi:hypothetical protein B0H11DRAFT_1940305 [Mycena galericulata]|nr:hypothetical protein B0H11DRAFT_1940305 [Mycena galericulata]